EQRHAVVDVEVILEAHAVRNERMQGARKSQWRCEHDRLSQFARGAIQKCARIHGKKIDGVDDDIDVLDELLGDVRLQPGAVFAYRQCRMDIGCHVRHHVHFRSFDGFGCRTDLTIDVLDAKPIKIGDVEPTYAHADQVEQVAAAQTAEAGNGNPTFSQALLLGLGYQANIALEGQFVIVGRRDHF